MSRLVKSIRVSCLIGIALCAWPSVTLAKTDDETPPPAPIGTQVADLPGVRVVERVIEGHPLAAAVLPEALGRGLAVLLVHRGDGLDHASNDASDEPAEGDETLREVWALFADPELAPRRLAGDLPAALEDMERHGDELWLGGDGVIYRLDPAAGAAGGGATAILAAPGLELNVLELTGLLDVDGGVAIPELGRLRVLDPQLQETAVLPLPVSASRRSGGFLLSSPHVVRPRADNMPFFAGPEPQGSTRLLVRILDPGAQKVETDDGNAESRDAWIRLPSPEDVERSKFVVLDGIPRLAITTTDAEKLGIFEEMAFRLYALRTDRTRGGIGPLMAVQTETKHWYKVGIEIADLNGDGKDDLALLQPEGMGAGDLFIDVYLGLGDGRVATGTKRRSKLDAPSARWHWGDDMTGDEVPDLFVASEERVELFPGDKDHRSRVLEKRAAWGWEPGELKAAMHRTDGEGGPMPSGHYSRVGRIRAHDLDGDGDMDLSLSFGRHGRAVVRFVLPRALNEPD